jgi:hypothetical protein
MSYYQGDYGSNQLRRVGVARGDPGFFSFLGGAAKSLLGMVPGVGPVLSTVAGHLGAGAGGGIVKAAKGGIMKAGSAVAKHPALTAAGAAGAVGLLGAGAAIEHAVTGGHKKHKRMNVYNPRALRRALRRAHGFAKMARRIIRVTHHYKHPKRFNIGHFKKKSKKK